MAKKKSRKKKLSTLTIAMLAVALVGAVLAVVGLFNDWMHYSIGDNIETESMTLQDFAETESANQIMMQTFAWIAGILAVAGFALVLVRMLVNIGPVRLVGKIAGIGAVLFGVLALIFSFVVASEGVIGGNFGFSIDIDGVGWELSYGAYLLAAGSIVGGIGAFVGSKK